LINRQAAKSAELRQEHIFLLPVAHCSARVLMIRVVMESHHSTALEECRQSQEQQAAAKRNGAVDGVDSSA